MTIIGFIFAIVILTFAILADTKDPTTFLNPHAIMIVFGGTLAAALISYRAPEMIQIAKGLWVVFRMPIDEHEKFIALFCDWADVVRTRGLSAIEPDVEALPPCFAKDGLELLLNGFKRDEIAEIMEANIKNLVLRERIDSNIFKTMALIAPAFGLVGTLIGLILMLRRLDDVTKIAPAMSTAMTATFYGVVLANLIFLPFSVKLARRTEVKVQFYKMILDGILMLADKRPSHYVAEKLNAYLPPKRRVKKESGSAVKA